MILGARQQGEQRDDRTREIRRRILALARKTCHRLPGEGVGEVAEARRMDRPGDSLMCPATVPKSQNQEKGNEEADVCPNEERLDRLAATRSTASHERPPARTSASADRLLHVWDDPVRRHDLPQAMCFRFDVMKLRGDAWAECWRAQPP